MRVSTRFSAPDLSSGPIPMRTLPPRLLPILLLAAAMPAVRAAADADAAQADFTGKFVCVEDADNAWPLSRVHLKKIGAREFLVGEMVPPPPEPAGLAESPTLVDDTKDNPKAEGHPAKHRPAKAGDAQSPKHRRVMLPVDKVVDIQVFDSAADLNAYYDALDNPADADGETLKVH